MTSNPTIDVIVLIGSVLGIVLIGAMAILPTWLDWPRRH